MVASLDEFPQQIAELANRNTPLKIFESLLLVFLITVALIGNVVVGAAIFKVRRLRTLQNMFVINLAVSDILMAVVCMPISLCVLISGEWPFSAAVCDMQGFFMFSFAIVSVGNMSAIAVNRYFAVCRPFNYKVIFTRRNVFSMIAFLWILPSIASVPPLAGWGYYAFNGGKAFCIYPFNVNMFYTVIVEVLFIAFPMGLIAFSFTKCIMTIRSNNRQVAQMEDNSLPANQELRKAREIRATWTMLFATLGFSMCWFPVSVIDFVDTFTGGGNLPRQVFMLNGFLIFTSSTINPFIYWLTNRDFRKAYREVLSFTKRSEENYGDENGTLSTGGQHTV